MKWHIADQVVEFVAHLAAAVLVLAGVAVLAACVAKWDVGAGSAEVCKLSESSCTPSQPRQSAPAG